MTNKLDIEQLIAKMNAYGANRIPFLFAIDFDLTSGFFVENPLAQHDILFRLPQINNLSKIAISKSIAPELTAHPISFESYQKRFQVIHQGLMRGDSYLCNLTMKTPIDISTSLRDVFIHSNSLFGLYIPNEFACFSPERFVRIQDNRIFTYPMKGTIEADIPDAEHIILADQKEAAEHATVVDLLRNDLGIVGSNIMVDRYRFIDTLHTNNGDILQVSSEISGTLPTNYNERLGDMILQLLPAGSICGAPKQSTIEMIHQAEPESRGFYTGVFGYFDGSSLDSAVMIRFISQEEDAYFFHSGGGITVNSDAVKEYEEMLAKIYLTV